MGLLEVGLPKKVIIGDGALEKIGSLCQELDLKGSVIFFTGPTVMEIVGKKVLEILESYDFDVNVKILPKKIEMNHLENQKNCDFIVGVGGGRVIDAAKVVANSLFMSKKIPFISVPTAVSHDGIASDRAVIDSYSIQAIMPTAIVIDTDVIKKSPYRLTASGCADVISKLTAVADWELAHRKNGEYISEYAATINRKSAELIMSRARSIRKLEKRGLRNLIEALVFSGVSMSMAGSSRPASGSEHLFSHSLKKLYPDKTSLHGEECGVGTILCSYLHNMNWQKVVRALETIGAPINSKQLKIPEKILVKALSEAKNIRRDRYTILHDKNIDETKALKAASETEVI
jgi:glycerol-1-phosphate dehydrogenase [NAD(P)+]